MNQLADEYNACLLSVVGQLVNSEFTEAFSITTALWIMGAPEWNQNSKTAQCKSKTVS